MNATHHDLLVANRVALDQLLPMHLHLSRDGQVLGSGPTLRKLLGDRYGPIAAIFVDARPGADGDLADTILRSAGRNERLFLRMRTPPLLTLRGHAVAVADGTLLVNLGFGIALTEAVAFAGLTDSDFAPPELAMELLFLHEANRAVLGELSMFNHQLEEARVAAEIKAHTDPLTGLANRRGLGIALAAACRATQGSEERVGFALAHLDLDRFKQVNDLLGHEAGDHVLCDVGRILRETTRGGDTIARIGGDEFVLILPGLEKAAALQRLASRIIAGTEGLRPSAAADCRVSASIGVTRACSYPTICPDRLLRDADAALYRAKHAGRGRAIIWSAQDV